MEDLEHLDWSFGLVLAMVSLLVVLLVIRHLVIRRQERRAAKKARHAAYREWLHSSGMELPKQRRRRH